MDGIIIPELVIVRYTNGYTEQRNCLRGQIGAARPLSRSTMLKITKDFIEEAANVMLSGSPMPNCVHLSTSLHRTMVAWTSEAKERYLFSDMAEIPNGMQKCPRMLFVYDTGDFYAYALNEDKKICHAPYGNISDNGSVCMAVRKSTDLTEIYANEDIFWRTEFTHESGNQLPNIKAWQNKNKLTPFKQQLYAFQIP